MHGFGIHPGGGIRDSDQYASWRIVLREQAQYPRLVRVAYLRFAPDEDLAVEGLEGLRQGRDGMSRLKCTGETLTATLMASGQVAASVHAIFRTSRRLTPPP